MAGSWVIINVQSSITCTGYISRDNNVDYCIFSLLYLVLAVVTPSNEVQSKHVPHLPLLRHLLD